MDRGRNREAEEQSVEGPVPMHPLLAEFLRAWKEQTMYSRPTEWVFASTKCKGQQPRVTNMLVEDYLRPAAVKAGVLKSKKNEAGELVDDDPRRFGFHNLRHSLASFLVRSGTDITTSRLCRTCSVTRVPRSQSTGTCTSVGEDRMAAQGKMLEAILNNGATAQAANLETVL